MGNLKEHQFGGSPEKRPIHMGISQNVRNRFLLVSFWLPFKHHPNDCKASCFEKHPFGFRFFFKCTQEEAILLLVPTPSWT